MIDIVSGAPGQDLKIFETNVYRAKNILSIQIGSLEYAPEFGIDIDYFLSERFQFQNQSFRAYLVQVLANNQINVSIVQEEVDTLSSSYTVELAAEESSTALIAR